jgi:hypothetical protein
VVRDQYWRIEHAFSDGPDTATPILGHNGPEPTTAPGASYSLEVWFTGAADSPAGAWPDAPERLDTIRSIGGPASATVVHNMMGDSPDSYTAVGATAGTGGGLVTIHPPAGVQCGRGGHFACTAVEDMTTRPEEFGRVEMELTRLASLSDYPDRAAARDALEAPI